MPIDVGPFKAATFTSTGSTVFGVSVGADDSFFVSGAHPAKSATDNTVANSFFAIFFIFSPYVYQSHYLCNHSYVSRIIHHDSIYHF